MEGADPMAALDPMGGRAETPSYRRSPMPPCSKSSRPSRRAWAAHRWDDLSPAVKAYALSASILDPARVFHASIAHKVLRHVRPSPVARRLADCETALQGSVEAVHGGQSLDVAIAQHRKALEHPDAYERFLKVTATDMPKVH